jgi:mxaJ protein
MKRLLIAAALLGAATCCLALTPVQARDLRVCADPNNLPFSNDKGEGFENKIIALIGKDINAHVTYTWWAQRRGFVRHTLYSEACDLWPGVAAQQELLSPTQPYYRSTYVFLTRTDRHLDIHSFDDPRLKKLKIGVEMIGYDAQNTPPAHALARRGITQNVRGFSVLGDYRKPSPASAIVDAVADGQIDVGIAWGPLAGYFASKASAPMTVASVQPQQDSGRFPMTFAISMGIRRGDNSLARDIDRALIRNKSAIDAILAAYHVPMLAEYPGPPAVNAPDSEANAR